MEKVFVIINSYLIGDIILVNSLVQNIKRIYKNSKVIMLSSPKLVDICKNQQGVDEVIIWDRHNKHKGLLGMIKFIKNFPYKKIYASFPIYGLDRPVILPFLMGSKYILFYKNIKKSIFKHLFKSKYKIENFDYNTTPMQQHHLRLLSGITKEALIDCKLKYNVDLNNISPNVAQVVNSCSEYKALCPVSSRITKDMPYETVCEIIKNTKENVILLGNGEISKKLSEKLEKENFSNLIDLSNKTTINEAAFILSKAKGVISVDTGLAHLACALEKKMVMVFYEVETSPFMPDEKLYPIKVIYKNQSSENILKELSLLFS